MKAECYDESGPMPEIEMCENCYCINEAGNDRCSHCNFFMKEGVRKRTKEIWVEIYNLMNPQFPKSTISDHLKDCFGFLCYKRHDRFDEFVDAFCKSLGEAMPYLKHQF